MGNKMKTLKKFLLESIVSGFCRQAEYTKIYKYVDNKDLEKYIINHLELDNNESDVCVFIMDPSLFPDLKTQLDKFTSMFDKTTPEDEKEIIVRGTKDITITCKTYLSDRGFKVVTTETEDQPMEIFVHPEFEF